MNKKGECPFHHGDVPGEGLSKYDSVKSFSQYHREIGTYISQLKEGVELTLDTPEKTQAYYAYMLFLLGGDISSMTPFFDTFVQSYEGEKVTFREITEQSKAMLIKKSNIFFRTKNADPSVLPLLQAGLTTFHDFVKRAVILNSGKGDAHFPLKQAINLASTAMNRANYMACNPDITAWQGLFFDPDVNVSQLYLGIPLERPIYRCPIIYSGKMREIIDFYYAVLCQCWSASQDKPQELTYFSHK